MRKILSDIYSLLAPMLLTVHQGSGLGRIRPNVLLMGFKRDWCSDSPEAAHNYIVRLQ